MVRQIYKDGKWQDGAAQPELIREDLRKLPADYVTKDEGDHDKIHENDASHIAETLKEELDAAQNPKEGKKETLEKNVKKLKCAPRDKIVPLNQWEIDCVRMRIIHSTLERYLRDINNGKCPDIFAKYYVWFPNNNVNEYELKKGNPPANSQRPKHLKRFKLHLDIYNWPRHIKAVLKEQRTYIPSSEEILAMLQAAFIRKEQDARIITL